MGNYRGKFTKKARQAKRKKKAVNKKNVVLLVLLVFLSLLLAVLIGGIIYYNSVLDRINRFEDMETLSSEEFSELLNTISDAELDEDAQIGTVPETMDVMGADEEQIGGDIINILLIGQDTRNVNKKGLSDSIILVSVNKETKKLVMTSFIRDLYVEIPSTNGGYYKQRINTAYPVGGMEKLDATLKHNFGVEVDNNIEVDFSGFQTIVDAMGGVDIELTKAEAYHLNTNPDYAPKHWNLKQGLNHLNGEQALAYSRIRKIDDDFVRTSRQRTVLTKLLEKVKNLSLTELIALAEEFIPLITTDMTNKEITSYIMQIAPILSDLEIITQRIPEDGTWWGTDIGTPEQPSWVICANLTNARRLLRSSVGLEESDPTE